MHSKRGWAYLCQDHFDLMEKNPRFTILWHIRLVTNDHACGACRQENIVKVAAIRSGYRYESR